MNLIFCYFASLIAVDKVNDHQSSAVFNSLLFILIYVLVNNICMNILLLITHKHYLICSY